MGRLWIRLPRLWGLSSGAGRVVVRFARDGGGLGRAGGVMRVRARVGIGMLATALVVGSTTVSPAVGAAAATLGVPASPAGDVVVEVTAAPLDAPYVQVVLVRGSGVLGPEHWARAIAPLPERNFGGSTQITVPTWGLSATDGTFVLLGCDGADSSSCTTVLASQTRHIVQTALASGSLDVPAQPVFIPEEQVLVSADNSGGGEMVAQFRGVGGRDVVPSGDSVVFTAYPATSAVEQLDLQRCSALTASPNYCEPPVASEAVSFVTGIEVNPVFGQQLPRITVDSSWHSSTAEVAVYTTGQSHRLSWSLYDAEGEQVVAPVDVPVGTSGLDQVEISPGAHAAGALSDGIYTVRFDVTVSKGDLIRTGTAERQIEIINDPPADQPEILAARRTWRPVAGWGRCFPGSACRPTAAATRQAPYVFATRVDG